MTAITRILMLLTPVILAGCFEDTPQTPEPSDPMPQVTVAEVQPWQQPASKILPGVVRPGKRAVLSTRIAGTLISVNVEPGDAVEAGDLLAETDAREVNAGIAAARANISAAESAVQQARQDHQRLKRLYEEDLIARVRVEQAQVQLDQLKAKRQQAQSDLDARQSTLSYARITAPFAGQIAETLVDAGSFVGPGTALLVLEAREHLRVDVPVSSQQAASLTPGQLMSVMTESKKPLPAHLTGVIPALENKGTGQRLRLSLQDTEHELAPGQVVSVLVPDGYHQEQPRQNNWVGLPEDALIRRGQLTGALVVNETEGSSAVHLTWVTTVNPPGNNTQLIPVTEGLKAGDRVVLNPSAELQDGQSVTIALTGNKNGGQ